MTGFARAAGSSGAATFAWELRSVNGKTLEARFRLPPGFDSIEPPARQVLGRLVSRGSVQATLTVQRSAERAAPLVDRALLAGLAALAVEIQRTHGLAAPTVGELLALPGVLSAQEQTVGDDDRKALDAAILSSFEDAAAALVEARATEGAVLGDVLSGHLDEIERLTGAAANDPSRDIATVRRKLADQVAALMTASPSLDEQRLYAEAVLLATKADISEELDRLAAHVAAARDLLSGGGVIGRRLDFLAQEFNRESNTLCSKSSAASLTAIGLDLKAVVDRFREQVQNLE